MSARFDIDLEDLQERHRKISRAVHPDRFAGADPRTRRMALEQSMLANDAYNTLKNPVSRARYLLVLNGVLQSDDDKELGQAPQMFLMEMMELREELEDADGEKKAKSLADLKSRRDEAVSELGQLFGNSDGSGESLEPVRAQLAKLKYIDSILNQFADRPELRG